MRRIKHLLLLLLLLLWCWWWWKWRLLMLREFPLWLLLLRWLVLML